MTGPASAPPFGWTATAGTGCEEASTRSGRPCSWKTASPHTRKTGKRELGEGKRGEGVLDRRAPRRRDRSGSDGGSAARASGGGSGLRDYIHPFTFACGCGGRLGRGRTRGGKGGRRRPPPPRGAGRRGGGAHPRQAGR